MRSSNASAIDSIKAQTPMFGVLEPVMKAAEEVTADDLRRLKPEEGLELAIEIIDALKANLELIEDEVIRVADGGTSAHAGCDSESSIADYSISVNVDDSSKSKPRVSKPKSYMTHNKWTQELRDALKRSAFKGKPVSEIYAESQKHGLPFTENAIKAQLRNMGFSIKNGIPVPKGSLS